jgi:hypothetical protein
MTVARITRTGVEVSPDLFARGVTSEALGVYVTALSSAAHHGLAVVPSWSWHSITCHRSYYLSAVLAELVDHGLLEVDPSGGHRLLEVEGAPVSSTSRKARHLELVRGGK